MVTQLGMSESFGNIDLYTEYHNLSSETKNKIEHEVGRILEEGRKRATKILIERRHDLDVLAMALVEYEVLNADEIRRVLKGEKLPKLTTLPNVPIKVPELLLPPVLGGPGGGKSGALGATPGGGSSTPSGSGGAKL